eukprot:gene18534-biopygen2426
MAVDTVSSMFVHGEEGVTHASTVLHLEGAGAAARVHARAAREMVAGIHRVAHHRSGHTTCRPHALQRSPPSPSAGHWPVTARDNAVTAPQIVPDVVECAPCMQHRTSEQNPPWIQISVLNKGELNVGRELDSMLGISLTRQLCRWKDWTARRRSDQQINDHRHKHGFGEGRTESPVRQREYQ